MVILCVKQLSDPDDAAVRFATILDHATGMLLEHPKEEAQDFHGPSQTHHGK